MITLFIRNLSYRATTADVRGCLQGFPLGAIRILEGRGIAFVEIEEGWAAQAIAVCDGKSILGRTIRVKIADEQENH